MDRKRVTFFLQDFAGGGAEKMMVHLANELAERSDIHFELLVVRKKGPYVDLLSDKIHVIKTKSHRVLGAIRDLMGYMNHEKPDVMMTTLKHSNIALILAKKLSRANTKIIIREACHLVYDSHAPLRQKIAYFLVPYIYPLADTIIAVSEGVRKSVVSKINSHKNLVVRNNPVISNHVLDQMEEEVSDLEFGNEVKTIMGLGRLTHQKDYHTLIKAFKKLVEELPNTQLIILGEGPLRQELSILISNLDLNEKVKLIGFRKNPYKYLCVSDLFVLSSLYEGSPNVLVEAMACGLPVVSTDCPSGPMEILENGKYGLLVEMKNVDELAKAMKMQLTSPISADLSIGKANSYRSDKVVSSYVELFS